MGDPFERLHPVIEAERRRGNRFSFRRTEREHRELWLPTAIGRYPLDRAAIDAEFDLGPDIHWLTFAPETAMLVTPVAQLLGGSQTRGPRAVLRGRAWWRAWRSSSQERRPL
jgi:hypothetical protein